MTTRVRVITLGGTIAMTSEGDRGAEPTLDAADLVAAVPALATVGEVGTESFRRVPGAYLGLADIAALARRILEILTEGEADGVVVTQGTDTLEETAFVLDLLAARRGPIVVTGAMRSPSLPGADGPANLLGAVRLAGREEAAEAGVLVVMNDEIHAARFVAKLHSSNPGAFGSPSLGPVGWVSEERVRLAVVPRPVGPLLTPEPVEQGSETVALLRIGLGDDGRLIEAVPDLGHAGAVIEAFGAGHLSERLVGPVSRLAERMPVVLSSRTGGGEVFRHTYGFPGSERDLLARGLVWGGSLGGVKARLLLTCGLRAGWDRARLAEAFELYS